MTVLVLAFLLQLALVFGRPHSTTLNPYPNSLTLTDLNKDNIDDWVAWSEKDIYGARSNFLTIGYFHKRIGGVVEKVFSGQFKGHGKTSFCALLALDGGNKQVECFQAIKGPDIKSYLTQENFIGADEEVLVGHFMGTDDQLLLFKKDGGHFRLFMMQGNQFVERTVSKDDWLTMPALPTLNARVGNLADIEGAKCMFKKEGETKYCLSADIRCFECAQNTTKTCPKGAPHCWVEHPKKSVERDDVVLVDEKTGDIVVYLTIQIGENIHLCLHSTHAAYTGTTLLMPKQLQVANIDGGDFEAIVKFCRNTISATYDTVDPKEAKLVPLTKVEKLNLLPKNVVNADAQLFFADLKNSIGKVDKRDDPVVFFNKTFIFGHAIKPILRSHRYITRYIQSAIVLSEDQDGDALLTAHELGHAGPNAPLHTWGASPFAKDIFVEVDYMNSSTTSRDLKFKKAARNLAIKSMALRGINLHIIQDEEVPYNYTLGTFEGPQFDWIDDFDKKYRDIYFKNKPEREGLFHYCLFADSYNWPNTSSGRSRGIPGSDLIVTLGSWHKGETGSAAGGTVTEQAGTFLHELGHNLGLMHGGSDHVGYKPNHPSIMNYLFQTAGVDIDNSRQFIYSDLNCANVNEADFDEATGVTCTIPADNKHVYKTLFRRQNVIATINKKVDVDGDRAFGNHVNLGDVNLDKSVNTLFGTKNEYAAMVFNGGSLSVPPVLLESQSEIRHKSSSTVDEAEDVVELTKEVHDELSPFSKADLTPSRLSELDVEPPNQQAINPVSVVGEAMKYNTLAYYNSDSEAPFETKLMGAFAVVTTGRPAVVAQLDPFHDLGLGDAAGEPLGDNNMAVALEESGSEAQSVLLQGQNTRNHKLTQRLARRN